VDGGRWTVDGGQEDPKARVQIEGSRATL